jgi:hypothetical protein
MRGWKYNFVRRARVVTALAKHQAEIVEVIEFLSRLVAVEITWLRR